MLSVDVVGAGSDHGGESVGVFFVFGFHASEWDVGLGYFVFVVDLEVVRACLS